MRGGGGGAVEWGCGVNWVDVGWRGMWGEGSCGVKGWVGGGGVRGEVGVWDEGGAVG